MPKTSVKFNRELELLSDGLSERFFTVGKRTSNPPINFANERLLKNNKKLKKKKEKGSMYV